MFKQCDFEYRAPWGLYITIPLHGYLIQLSSLRPVTVLLDSIKSMCRQHFKPSLKKNTLGVVSLSIPVTITVIPCVYIGYIKADHLRSEVCCIQCTANPDNAVDVKFYL